MYKQQKQEGQNNQQAGRDIINLSLPTSQYDFEIAQLLKIFYDTSPQVEFNAPNTTPYDIKSKIDHNNLKLYKSNYIHYDEKRLIIREKIAVLTQENADAAQRIYNYVQGKYLSAYSEDKTPDEIIKQIVDSIQEELKHDCVTKLTAGDLGLIHHIVFFVFSECKIFEPPPS